MAKSKKPLSTKDINKLFISSMKKVSVALGVEPNKVSQAQFFANDPNDIAEWDVRKAGGFNNLKKLYFPAEENLEVLNGSKLVQAHRKRLESKYGVEEFFLNELSQSITEALKSNPIKLYTVPKKPKAPKTSAAKKRTIVAHLSDTHYGANVEKAELAGKNEFNWTIAARRTAHFIDQVCSYKPHYRQDTDLILCINGDIIAGQIHDQEWFVNLLTTQFSGTLSILSQAISYAANHFNSVTVVCTTGNHGRNVGKANKGRASTHKWDSYEHMIYVSLREIFKKVPSVKFTIPESPYVIFDAQGHKFFQTHGDTVVNVGNPGNALNMRSINDQINKINASEGKKISGLIVGHVHTPTVQLTESGCMILINGCLSGTDPFAQSIGIFDSNPTQMLFEVTQEHAVGDIRLVQLNEADKKTRLDLIIAPFLGKF